ncbi:MBOAT family O-acyltransferase [Microbaculum marinum]|uniref:Probable alginate O-acetylase AlgI n=1 Tax=Microbaculum marinum TaxID=1764581 RepID=A0AAW9RIK3_9HYPH
MVFSSFEFLLLFLPLVILGFWLAGKLHYYISVLFLILASLFFYGYFRVDYVLILVSSIVGNYLVGEYLRAHKSRPVLTLAVAANVALLVYYKYSSLAVWTLAWSLGAQWPLPEILLPLAISFFTFQQIAYVVDSFHRTTERGSFLDYALFVSFFPQLIAGPIVRQQEVVPDIRDRRLRIVASNFATGLSIFVAGLAKKVVLADEFAAIADPAFDTVVAGDHIGSAVAWTGLLAYSLQIYFDFSAYSDMAIGIGLIFGLHLPINFDSPYKSRSIVEFWRRWHITLSRFLRDYLYIPLGGNRKGAAQRYVNLMITMLLGGLWHGAGWSFMLWGGLHGCYLVVNHVAGAIAWSRIPGAARVLSVVAWPLTFLAVILAWVPFRAFEGTSFLDYYASLVSSVGAIPPAYDVLIVAVGLGICVLMPNVAEIFDLKKADGTALVRLRWQRTRTAAALTGLLLFVALFVVLKGRPYEFIYFQF